MQLRHYVPDVINAPSSADRSLSSLIRLMMGIANKTKHHPKNYSGCATGTTHPIEDFTTEPTLVHNKNIICLAMCSAR